MPFTLKEQKILEDLIKKHGKEKGEEMFYSMVNEGKLGLASKRRHQQRAKKT